MAYHKLYGFFRTVNKADPSSLAKRRKGSWVIPAMGARMSGFSKTKVPTFMDPDKTERPKFQLKTRRNVGI
jgi:hypothetical protein